MVGLKGVLCRAFVYSTFFWDAVYKFQFPQFALRVARIKIIKKIWGKAYKTNWKMRSVLYL